MRNHDTQKHVREQSSLWPPSTLGLFWPVGRPGQTPSWCTPHTHTWARLLSPGFQVNWGNEVAGDVAGGEPVEGENVPRQFLDVTVVADDARQGALPQLRPLPPGKHSFSLPPEPARIQTVASIKDAQYIWTSKKLPCDTCLAALHLQ